MISGLIVEQTNDGYHRLVLDPCYGLSGEIKAKEMRLRLEIEVVELLDSLNLKSQIRTAWEITIARAPAPEDKRLRLEAERCAEAEAEGVSIGLTEEPHVSRRSSHANRANAHCYTTVQGEHRIARTPILASCRGVL